MTGAQLNEEIMKTIHESTDTEQSIKDFVIALIFEEIKDPSRWTEIYRKKLNIFAGTREGK